MPPARPTTQPPPPEESRAPRPLVPTSPFRLPSTPQQLTVALARAAYLAPPSAALALWLALKLEKPLLVEGPSGVGKTDLARAAAATLGRPLIRLQCHQGLDESRALYDWDHAKQHLYVQLLREVLATDVREAASIADAADRIASSESVFYGERFLVARPLLAAIQSAIPAVLLIDEIDRAAAPFEAFLLEVLSEFQVTIPEIGTIKARHRPLVVLTNNRARDVSDTLRRRCLYARIDSPTPSQELAILRLRAPGLDEALARDVVLFIEQVRALDLRKFPSVAEVVDWVHALHALGVRSLETAVVRDTLGVLLKHEDDRAIADQQAASLVQAAVQKR